VEAALVNKLISALLPCELETLQNCSEFEEDRGPDDTVGVIPNPNLLESDEQNLNIVQKIDPNEVDKICEFYRAFVEETMSISEIVQSAEFLKLEDCLLKYKALLSKQSPTAKLWLQYIEYIETLKLFIRAKRSGNWSLHLAAVARMLNLFAATGHMDYVRVLVFTCS